MQRKGPATNASTSLNANAMRKQLKLKLPKNLNSTMHVHDVESMSTVYCGKQTTPMSQNLNLSTSWKFVATDRAAVQPN